MRPWPKCHKTLLGVTIVLALVLLGVAFLRLRPNWNEYRDLTDERAFLEEKLKASAWPRDSQRLEALLKEYEKRLNKDTGTGVGLKAQTDQVLRQATSLFLKRITDEYGSVADFMQKASQTEYKDQYDRLDSYLLGKQLQLDPATYGLNVSTSEPQKYQMLLKLWTTQAVVETALACNLRIASRRAGGQGGRPAAQITALPMRPYILSVNSAAPYLMEFPVQLEVRGSMESFSKFVDALCSDGKFLPMTCMEISVTAPAVGKRTAKPDQDGRIRTHGIVARVVCSGFSLPEGEGRTVEERSKLPQLPRGA